MSTSYVRGTLFVVGTPIGNLEDMTLRAIRILGSCDVIAAEDTRVTARLCARYGIKTRLVSFREQNAKQETPRLLKMLLSGKSVALVTDAGTPSVSDPGAELVEAARGEGIAVTPIPGPSALAAAVSVAGLPGEGIRFLGFLPRKGKERSRKIESMAADRSLLVIYEAPSRLKQTLTDLAKAFGARRAAVMREMTKLYEEITVGSLLDLVSKINEKVKGEITIVIEGLSAAQMADIELTEDRIIELIQAEIVKGRSAKDISESLSKGLGLSRKKIYDLVVEQLRI